MMPFYDFIYELDRKLGRLSTPRDLLDSAILKESESHGFFDWGLSIQAEKLRVGLAVSYLYLARRKARLKG